MARYRRNPEILGIDAEDAAVVAAGAWATQQVAGAAATLVPQLKAPLDAARPGLGLAAYQLVGAAVASRLVRFVKPVYAGRVALGGGAIAFSSFVNALLGHVNLIGGTPLVYGFLTPRSGGKSGQKLLTDGGTPASGSPSSPASLLGTGRAGF